MRVLVVGSRSFVGRRVAERLRAAHSVETAGRDAGAELRLALGEPARLPASGERRYDAVVHCAASFEPDTPAGMIRNALVNAVGALEVGELAVRTGCRQLVLLSTVSVFDEHEGRPRDSYSLSKRHGQENLALLCRAEGIALCTLCPGGVYDERGEGRRHQPLLYHIVDCARRGADFELYGTLDPLRNFLHVDDLAAVVEAALVSGTSGTFPVLHPDFHRVQAIAELAFRVFGRGGRVVRAPEKPDLRELRFPAAGDIFGRVGHPPLIDLPRGLELMRDQLG
ncbi:MAG TPA: NAD(P)-dependent oxidoreductase [Vicinamibacteria bacterium]